MIDDGALVNIGFDGSLRVTAAVGDTVEAAALHAGAVYFIASGPPDAPAEYHALRRVS